MTKHQNLPEKLQQLVHFALETLGQAIAYEFGDNTFYQVERIRQNMKGLRKKSHYLVYKKLVQEQEFIKNFKTKQLEEICTSFSFMLELINRCENAYRIFQLQKKDHIDFQLKPYAIILVATAHPTEARGKNALEIFQKIQDTLLKALNDQFTQAQDELFHLIMLGLKVSMATSEKPTVKKEAQNIYSHLLKDEILDSLINYSAKNTNISFRAWVGGDKDGHPGVNAKTMIESMQLSRNMLLDFIVRKLQLFEKELKILDRKFSEKFKSQLSKIYTQLQKLQKIERLDGKKVLIFKEAIHQLKLDYIKFIHADSPRLQEIERLFWIFPAIVVPLELREDSELIATSLKEKKSMAIVEMLKKLKSISEGFISKWYVRGLILSMVQTEQDIINGHTLLKQVFGKYNIPVVPLFENEKSLTNAGLILKKLFSKNKTIATTHQQKWGKRFEVMIGYSDSAKENGVIYSKMMIANALNEIEDACRNQKLIPVYFHGSGGSVERGGGSIQEQTAWWPRSALSIYKSTIQGEMVARNFSHQSIFKSQTQKIIEQYNYHLEHSPVVQHHKELIEFSKSVADNYKKTLKIELFKELIFTATPYLYMKYLKIGSRPSKRKQSKDLKSLRAIPWIMCWTQTRILFPTWWGVGTCYRELRPTQKAKLKKLYQVDPLFSSYIHLLSFTMAKIELGVWKLYIDQSSLSKNKKLEAYETFEQEYELVLKFLRAITGKRDLMWFRPWLGESIEYRSSMIHPLNLIQLEAIKRKEVKLLQESVTGIACGMMTTG